MTKKLFNNYLMLIIVISLLSNFIKMFFPTTDYLIGVVLCLTCLALNVYMFAFRYEENKKIQIISLAFFALSFILLILELISMEYPALKTYPFEPDSYPRHQITTPYSLLLFAHYANLSLRIVSIINSIGFATYFGLKIVKNGKANNKDTATKLGDYHAY